MRGIYVIVEGQTEEEFVRNTLAPFFASKGIHDVRGILVATSRGFKGGDLKYQRFKRTIERLLLSEKDILVTSLIDLYRLQSDFPEFQEARSITDPIKRVGFLESACAQDINHNRFIPYIQLHEFEGLVFAGKKGFNAYFTNLVPVTNMKELHDTVDSYPNPELINDGAETAPSKRLLRLIPRYKKPLFGNMLILENGFDALLGKCPRFTTWVNGLVDTYRSFG